MDGFKQYEGKKIYVSLNNGRFYSGIVKEINDEGSGLVFISIIDKFGSFVTFSSKEILLIQEEK